MQIYNENESSKHRRKRDVSYNGTLNDRRKRRSRFVRILLKYTKLYCKYTKLAGFKYFVEPEATWFDRMLWFLVYAITVPMMIYTVYYGFLVFLETPLMTTVETEPFLTQKLDFPGIGICSINRISRRSAMEMASELANFINIGGSFAANISRLSYDEILDMISQLGDLYDSEFITQKRFYRIDQLLTVFYDGYYSITDVMKRLTPQCSSILLKCRFHGEERNCSDLFDFRKTQDGFCCTFNYAVKGDDTPLNNGINHRMEPMKVEKLTEDGGLTVLLEPFLDDYFYPIFPSTGWKVTIFNPFDYPDMSSGGVFEMLVSPNMHRSVEIQAIMFYSSKSIVSFPVEKRDCVFADEMVTLRAFYTYSDCIVDCKIEDMWKLCGCIPFYLPNRESRRVCNLEDVACLSQHKSKWISVVPHEDLYNDESLNNSRILHCYKCYSECSDVRYDAKIATSDLLSDGNIFNILDNTELVDQGVLSVYFEQFGTVRLKQDVIYRWYELMSEASGVCGIFVGFSLIAVVEFAYFVGLFVLELLKGPASSDGKEKLAERKQAPVQTIYWGELFSNARTTKNQRDRARGKY